MEVDRLGVPVKARERSPGQGPVSRLHRSSDRGTAEKATRRPYGVRHWFVLSSATKTKGESPGGAMPSVSPFRRATTHRRPECLASSE
ncbi:hypothetical protein HDE_03442 [Halotydeus destructor]|nr:hypothetical protein HDE_03442 [Halotydeus destructor]